MTLNGIFCITIGPISLRSHRSYHDTSHLFTLKSELKNSWFLKVEIETNVGIWPGIQNAFEKTRHTESFS